VADTLIAQTDAGDKLYQRGATANPESVGLDPESYRRIVAPPGETQTWAFGYVQYADGRTYEVKDLGSFLMHATAFEQVADIDFTVRF